MVVDGTARRRVDVKAKIPWCIALVGRAKWSWPRWGSILSHCGICIVGIPTYFQSVTCRGFSRIKSVDNVFIWCQKKKPLESLEPPESPFEPSTLHELEGHFCSTLIVWTWDQRCRCCKGRTQIEVPSGPRLSKDLTRRQSKPPADRCRQDLKCNPSVASKSRFQAPASPPQGGAAGASHDNLRAQTCTFERTGASNTTKIPRKRPKEREKEKTTVA